MPPPSTPAGQPPRAYNTPAQSPAAPTSSSSSASARSFTSGDYSYFSPQAPSSASGSPYSSSNSTSTTTSSRSTGPIITALVTSRNSSGMFQSHPPPPNPHHHHSQPSDVLQQFALHIPAPPPISLSLAALRHPAPEASLSAPRVSVASVYPPTPSTSTNFDSFPSPMDRNRRMPPSNLTPNMTLTSSQSTHTLSVKLPASIQPEMVTISANKGDRLKVVADAWHMEGESHYEWQISFPPYDIDITAVHAKFDPDGRLTIDVKRRSRQYF